MKLTKDQQDWVDMVKEKEEPTMTEEQNRDMSNNWLTFGEKYVEKYIAGQKEHSGNLWEMGLKQAVGNAKEEVLDMWSYLMTIEKIMGEIDAICDDYIEYTVTADIKEIISRRKKD